MLCNNDTNSSGLPNYTGNSVVSHKGTRFKGTQQWSSNAKGTKCDCVKASGDNLTNKITSIHLPKKEAKFTCIFQQGRFLLDMHPGYKRMHVSRDAEEVPEFLKADFPELELLTHLEFTWKSTFWPSNWINQLITRVGLTSLLLPLLTRQTILS